MERQDLIDYLVNEEVLSEHQAHEMDSYSLYAEALQYNGILGYDKDIKEWIEPYYQDYYSKHPDELDINVNWVKDMYHRLVDAGIIKENESEPKPQYPNDIFLP